MNKATAIALSKKYNMDFIRNPITREGCGVYLQSDRCIPELEKLAEESTQSNELTPCCMELQRVGRATIYRLYVPSSWIDLWGWAE